MTWLTLVVCPLQGSILMPQYPLALSLSAVRRAQSIVQLFAWSGLFLLISLASGCSQKEPPTALPPAVKVFEVGSSQGLRRSSRIEESLSSQSARFSNKVSGELRSELSGTVIEVLVKPGQFVNAGQSLVRLDPRDAKLANSAAEVQVQAARAKLANVEADFTRYTELLNKGFISKAEWDRREALLIAEQAQFEATLDQLGVYTLRALRQGVIRQVFASKAQLVQASDPLIQFQERPTKTASGTKGPRSQPILQNAMDERALQIQSFNIPLSALLDGRIVMRVVSSEDKFVVEAIAVNILEVNERNAWVEGLVRGDRIVAVGAHLLSAGQTVRPLNP
jgi:multidrug efflux pump subunit AcrA (membrane-fusion protein)